MQARVRWQRKSRGYQVNGAEWLVAKTENRRGIRETCSADCSLRRPDQWAITADGFLLAANMMPGKGGEGEGEGEYHAEVV